ncbi:hypothetical protein [Streptomyces sp. NPDC026659]|uniref:hypothetical protein n=1 Tax=Streptomyces sp. NPDC026659 TaxID=3155123 RepID=UPI0033E27A5B
MTDLQGITAPYAGDEVTGPVRHLGHAPVADRRPMRVHLAARSTAPAGLDPLVQ